MALCAAAALSDMIIVARLYLLLGLLLRNQNPRRNIVVRDQFLTALKSAHNHDDVNQAQADFIKESHTN
jgi:hypothetical protein